MATHKGIPVRPQTPIEEYRPAQQVVPAPQDLNHFKILNLEVGMGYDSPEVLVAKFKDVMLIKGYPLPIVKPINFSPRSIWDRHKQCLTADPVYFSQGSQGVRQMLQSLKQQYIVKLIVPKRQRTVYISFYRLHTF